MDESREQVILVDEEDRETGLAPKLEAHRRGQRHRAISVCLTDPQGRMLLQRRAFGKYHSGGLWTNSCCTHPRPGEDTDAAARRRLKEEMGVDCALSHLFLTHYRAPVGEGLIEDEMVHVYHAVYTGPVQPDPAEVHEFGWFSRDFLMQDIAARPELYTYWFRHYLESYADAIFPAETRFA